MLNFPFEGPNLNGGMQTTDRGMRPSYILITGYIPLTGYGLVLFLRYRYRAKSTLAVDV